MPKAPASQSVNWLGETDESQEVIYSMGENPFEDQVYDVQAISKTQIPHFAPQRYAPAEYAVTRPVQTSMRFIPGPTPLSRGSSIVCYNCGEEGHISTNCRNPRKQVDYIPVCSNCKELGHTVPLCSKPLAPKPVPQYVDTHGASTSGSKSYGKDVQVQQVTVENTPLMDSSLTVQVAPLPYHSNKSSVKDKQIHFNPHVIEIPPDEGWPDESEIDVCMVTRSKAKRDKQKKVSSNSDSSDAAKEKKKAEKRNKKAAKKKEAEEQKKDIQPVTTTTAKDPDYDRDHPKYFKDDILGEVTAMLKEELGKSDEAKPEQSVKSLENDSQGKALPSAEHSLQFSVPPVTAKDDYSFLADLAKSPANITLLQLLANNPHYAKQMIQWGKNKKRSRTATRKKSSLPSTQVKMGLDVFKIEEDDHGAQEIDVVIDGSVIKDVPVDSGSGINIMTEDTAHALGFTKFEPCNTYLRMANQTKSTPIGMIRNVSTIIGGVLFFLNYVILQPECKMGFEVLIGRPWLYMAKVKTNWQKRTFSFKSIAGTAVKRVTISWGRPLPQGGKSSDDEGYTSDQSSYYDEEVSSTGVFFVNDEKQFGTDTLDSWSDDLSCETGSSQEDCKKSRFYKAVLDL
ncbi:hypothetical protein R1sor_011913 [Riccia sorocarpa]|uniref:CCHC-type domain-containing protein n=1 Tax=Riccia sorocarpa TaxID=122646 RepID=A0ABD3I507_9MARC